MEGNLDKIGNFFRVGQMWGVGGETEQSCRSNFIQTALPLRRSQLGFVL